MTPKEKALELIDKCMRYHRNGIYNVVHKDIAKQYAIIVVEEIIDALMYPPQLNEYRQVIHIKVLQYWQEVKQEIEKL